MFEAKALRPRPRPRPRPKFWPRGHFGIEDLTSLVLLPVVFNVASVHDSHCRPIAVAAIAGNTKAE